MPQEVDLRELERRILAIDEVRSSHHTHVWSLDGASHILSEHVVMDGNTSCEAAFRVKCNVRAFLLVHQRHTTVEMDYSEECPMSTPTIDKSRRAYTFSNTVR